MSSRLGLTVLFGLVIILMLENGASAVGLGETCTADTNCDTPANTLVCDTTSTTVADHKCRLKAGVSCATPNGGNCSTGLKCEADVCKIKNGTDCTGHDNDCVDGATCIASSGKQCSCHTWRSPAGADGSCAAVPASAAAGGPCATSSPACTGPDLVCQDNMCKIKHGASCTAHADLCVNGAACPTTGVINCSCDSTRFSPNQQGVCAAIPVPVSGNCTGGKACEDNLVCEGNICKIKFGTNCTGHENDCVDGATCIDSSGKQCSCHSWRSPATQDGRCKAAPAAGTAGGSCSTSSSTCTGPDLVCEDSICKIKHGADCTPHADLCVKNAACPTSGAKNCSCDSTKFSPTQQGVCTAKNRAPSLLASLFLVVGVFVTSRLV